MLNCRISSSIRDNTRSAKTIVKTKQPTVNRITLSRSSVVAMIRGVYWPPATWMATSSEPNVNTRKERFSVITVSSIDRAPGMDRPKYEVSWSSRPVRTSQLPMALVIRWNTK